MNHKPILVLSKLKSVKAVSNTANLKRYYFPFKGALCGHFIKGIIAISEENLDLGVEYLFYLNDWTIIETQLWGNLGKVVNLDYPVSQEFLAFTNA
jgi:hypothetical protein